MPVQWNLYIIVLVKMKIYALLHSSLEIVTTLNNRVINFDLASTFLIYQTAG